MENEPTSSQVKLAALAGASCPPGGNTSEYRIVQTDIELSKLAMARNAADLEEQLNSQPIYQEHRVVRYQEHRISENQEPRVTQCGDSEAYFPSTGNSEPLMSPKVAKIASVGSLAVIAIALLAGYEHHIPENVEKALADLKAGGTISLSGIKGNEHHVEKLVPYAWEFILSQESRVKTATDMAMIPLVRDIGTDRKNVLDLLTRVTGAEKYTQHENSDGAYLNASFDIVSQEYLNYDSQGALHWSKIEGARNTSASLVETNALDGLVVGPHGSRIGTAVAAADRLFILESIRENGKKYDSSGSIIPVLEKLSVEDGWPEVRESAVKTLEVLQGTKSSGTAKPL